MNERPGVGVNGEPDDFAARYDNLVRDTGSARMLRFVAVVALGVLLLFVVSLLD